MEEKNNSISHGERIILGGLILLFVVKGIERLWSWIQSPGHFILVAGLLLLVLIPVGKILWDKIKKKREKTLFEKTITAQIDDSVFCGTSDNGEDIWIKPRQRSMHTQVLGTTNAGKTESVILPWAIQDIHSGKGLLLIDGKADNSLIDKLWAYTKQAKRESDFKLFSLSRREQSFQFNPLLGGTAEEITQRVFNSFDFENPYYRSLQYEVMNQVMRIFEASNTTPTFQRLHQAISRPKIMEEMTKVVQDPEVRRWYVTYCDTSPKDREERTSGLLSARNMFRSFTSFCTILLSVLISARLQAQTVSQPPVSPTPGAPPKVGFAIIKTSQVAVPQALLVPGGDITRQVNSNFSAFLVKHHDDFLLFDTGLGQQIDAQYLQGMPLWWRPFFTYDKPVVSARTQLDRAGMPPLQRVILSHSHWDHAGGVQDFPEARIGIAAAERPRLRAPSTGPGGTWASQVGADAIRWEELAFQPVPFMGYPESLDLYQDGTVVLVPMPGHTPGSLGLFVTTDSGRRYFFIGDAAWTLAALRQGEPKFWVAGKLVDGDARQTQTSLEKVRALMQADPDLVVVPAHDSAVQDALGYFPAWVR